MIPLGKDGVTLYIHCTTVTSHMSAILRLDLVSIPQNLISQLIYQSKKLIRVKREDYHTSVIVETTACDEMML